MDRTSACRTILGPGLECGFPFHSDGEPRAGFAAVNNVAKFRGKEELREVRDDTGEDQKHVRGGGEKQRASGEMSRAPDRDPTWPRWGEGRARLHSLRPATKERRHAGRGGRGGVISYILSLEGQVEPSSQMQGCGEGADMQIWEDEASADLAVNFRVL